MRNWKMEGRRWKVEDNLTFTIYHLPFFRSETRDYLPDFICHLGIVGRSFLESRQSPVNSRKYKTVWKMEDRRWKMSEHRTGFNIFSFLNSKFYILYSKSACGRAVHSLRKTAGISASFIPSPAFCTHFVRRLWLTYVYYPLVVPRCFPQDILDFPSVNSLLYPLPTGLTIRATSNVN